MRQVEDHVCPANQHSDGWDTSSKAWAHMVLHLPHAEGGFGVTLNDITKDAAC